ncbi:MAG: hypothetical protein NT141_02720 [candidate division WWE3 bacterium]|nr:hypothetical protein [candidate division WWE3 bacterium]
MPTDNSPVNQPTTAPNIPEPPIKSNHRTLISIIIVVISLFIVGSLVYSAYYFGKSQTLNPTTTNNAVTPTKTTTATASATSDPTADWKTYTSQKGNFSIKYPQDSLKMVAISGCEGCIDEVRIVPVGNNGAALDNVDDVVGVILVSTNKISNLPFDQYFQKHILGDTNNIDVKRTILGGSPAASYRYAGGFDPLPITKYETIKDGASYILWIYDSVATNKDRSKYLTQFNQMISTFNFIDSAKGIESAVGTSTWKTYKDSRNSAFTFNYPAIYTLAEASDIVLKGLTLSAGFPELIVFSPIYIYGKTLEQYVQNDRSFSAWGPDPNPSGNCPCYTDITPVKFGSNSGLMFDVVARGSSRYIYLESSSNPGHVIKVTFSFLNKNDKIVKDLTDILSSFKFLNN